MAGAAAFLPKFQSLRWDVKRVVGGLVDEMQATQSVAADRYLGLEKRGAIWESVGGFQKSLATLAVVLTWA